MTVNEVVQGTVSLSGTVAGANEINPTDATDGLIYVYNGTTAVPVANQDTMKKSAKGTLKFTGTSADIKTLAGQKCTVTINHASNGTYDKIRLADAKAAVADTNAVLTSSENVAVGEIAFQADGSIKYKSYADSATLQSEWQSTGLFFYYSVSPLGDTDEDKTNAALDASAKKSYGSLSITLGTLETNA